MTTDSTPTPTTPKSRLRHLPTAVRLLLGLLFLASGLFGLLMPLPPMTSPPQPEALVAFFTGLVKSGYLFHLLKLTEAVVGALLLSNRFVPLALTILAPVTVNIVAVHAIILPSALPLAVAILAAHLYLAWSYRAVFRPMLAARATP